jgi:hypothetical protein
MEQDPGRQLSEARKQMVERRRLVIRSLGSGHDHEQMEAHINMMIKIQSAIDVIDRVAHDESARHDSEVECLVGGRIPVPSGSS